MLVNGNADSMGPPPLFGGGGGRGKEGIIRGMDIKKQQKNV